MKHALLSVIVALWCLKVSCRVSPVRSAVNGLWFCCGIILGLFLAQGWPALAFIEPENCSSTLTSFSNNWQQHRTVKTLSYTSIYTHRLELFSPPLPPATSCRRKGSFPVTFRLWLKHLFPTSCYCLPTQEVHHKCQENLRSGSLCVRWRRGGSVKLSWQERNNSVLSKTWVKKK